MTDLRKAAEMALKLLENNRLRTDEHLIPIVVDDLRNALAQDEQEPVWCGCGDGIVANDEAKCGVCVMRLENQIERLKAQPEQAPVAFRKMAHGMWFYIENKPSPPNDDYEPLYTAPPSKPWLSLSYRDITGAAHAEARHPVSILETTDSGLCMQFSENGEWHSSDKRGDFMKINSFLMSYARAIEAALRSKNNG